MGKYSAKKKTQKKSSSLTLWLVGICCIALPVAVIAISWALRETPAAQPAPTTVTTAPTTPSVLVPTFPTIPEETTTPTDPDTVYPYLSEDLVIDYIGSYAGIYMEDGTDDIVSNMMMLIVENTGAQDLQLARIDLQYSNFVANFEVTNLPVGKKIVLLEKNRHDYVAEMPLTASVKDVVTFSQPMSLLEDKISLSGGDGYLEITNISGADLTGELFIYYKNSASDLLYGGITYRVRITDAIPAGQTIRVMTMHYHPDRCSIMMVNYVE